MDPTTDDQNLTTTTAGETVFEKARSSQVKQARADTTSSETPSMGSIQASRVTADPPLPLLVTQMACQSDSEIEPAQKPWRDSKIIIAALGTSAALFGLITQILRLFGP